MDRPDPADVPGGAGWLAGARGFDSGRTNEPLFPQPASAKAAKHASMVLRFVMPASIG